MTCPLPGATQHHVGNELRASTMALALYFYGSQHLSCQAAWRHPLPPAVNAASFPCLSSILLPMLGATFLLFNNKVAACNSKLAVHSGRREGDSVGQVHQRRSPATVVGTSRAEEIPSQAARRVPGKAGHSSTSRRPSMRRRPLLQCGLACSSWITWAQSCPRGAPRHQTPHRCSGPAPAPPASGCCPPCAPSWRWRRPCRSRSCCSGR